MQNFTNDLFTLLGKRGYTDAVFTEVKRLINAGADVNYREDEYPFETVLSRALDDWNENNVLSMVKLLVEHGADINQPADIFYPLWTAAINDFRQVCEFFLDAGVKEGTDQAMRIAIQRDHIDIVKLFLQKGIDANPIYEGADSFLTDCCEAYRCRNESTDKLPGIETATLLLAAGADPDGGNLSPVKNAIAHNFLALADLLLEHGATLELDDNYPPCIFFARSKAGIEYLVGKGLSINTTRHDKMNRLGCAISASEMDLIPLLIELGIDLYAVDNKGYTPLHYAIMIEDKKELALLLPYYDLQKCDQIFPLDQLSQEKSIRKMLNLPVVETENPIPIIQDNIFIYCESDPVFLSLTNQAMVLYKTITEKNPLIDSYLMPWNALSAESLSGIYGDLQETSKQWNHHALQAIYIEYAGSVTDPFDSTALSWGYSSCDDSLRPRGLVFSESGAINFEYIFSDFSELTTHFKNLYSEIREYLGLVAFIHLHIAFSHFAQSAEYKALSITKPFYLFGNEHDHDAVLIYKMAQ